MTRRELVLSVHREAIRCASIRHKARAVALIGSVARGEDTDSSDYDFLVDFEPGASLFDLTRLSSEFEGLLGRDVDVVSTGGLKEKHRRVYEEAVPL